MKFLSRIPNTLILLACIVAFGLFVYPGLYKYDKLNQKFPVKINRITGQTQVLYPNGWSNMDGYDLAAIKMEEYKKEITDQIATQNEMIKNDVLLSIREEIDLMKDSISLENDYINFDAIRNRNKINQNATNPAGGDQLFGKGDSFETVEKIMGTPDSIIGGSSFEIWSYGSSNVYFRDGEVSGWSNDGKNLKIK